MKMNSIMKYIWDINGRIGYLNYSSKLDNLIVNELTKENITLDWIKNFLEKIKTIDPVGKHVSYNETIDVITDRIIGGILKYCKIDEKEAKNILTWLSENKYKNLNNSYQELSKLYKQNVTSNKEKLSKFLKKTKFKIENDALYLPVHKGSILNRLSKNEIPIPAKIWFWDGPGETIIVKIKIDEILSFSKDNNSIEFLIKNLKNIKPLFRHY